MTSLEGRERSSDEEGGLASQGEGEAERGASETAAVSPGEIAAGPQPPYDDDFNPFSEEGMYAYVSTWGMDGCHDCFRAPPLLC